jgi:hypothetical protein
MSNIQNKTQQSIYDGFQTTEIEAPDIPKGTHAMVARGYRKVLKTHPEMELGWAQQPLNLKKEEE